VLQGSINADVQVRGHFSQSTYNAIMEVAEWGVKDLYGIPNVHYTDIHVDGTGTSVVSARVAGAATFDNVDARNVGAVGSTTADVPLHVDRVGVLVFGEWQRRRRTTGPWFASWSFRKRSPATTTLRSRAPRPRPGRRQHVRAVRPERQAGREQAPSLRRREGESSYQEPRRRASRDHSRQTP